MEFDIMNAIGSLGFPIAVAVYHMMVSNKTMKETGDAMLKNSDAIKDLKNVIENNTKAIERLDK